MACTEATRQTLYEAKFNTIRDLTSNYDIFYAYSLPCYRNNNDFPNLKKAWEKSFYSQKDEIMALVQKNSDYLLGMNDECKNNLLINDINNGHLRHDSAAVTMSPLVRMILFHLSEKTIGLQPFKRAIDKIITVCPEFKCNNYDSEYNFSMLTDPKELLYPDIHIKGFINVELKFRYLDSGRGKDIFISPAKSKYHLNTPHNFLRIFNMDTFVPTVEAMTLNLNALQNSKYNKNGAIILTVKDLIDIKSNHNAQDGILVPEREFWKLINDFNNNAFYNIYPCSEKIKLDGPYKGRQYFGFNKYKVYNNYLVKITINGINYVMGMKDFQQYMCEQNPITYSRDDHTPLYLYSGDGNVIEPLLNHEKTPLILASEFTQI